MTSCSYKDKVKTREKKKKIGQKETIVRKKDNFHTHGLLVCTPIYNVHRGANKKSHALSSSISQAPSANLMPHQ